MTRAERLAPWIAGLALALPVLLVASPPACDFPQYERTVGLLRHFGDPDAAPRSLFVLDLGGANQGFFALAWILAWVMPAAWACKLVVAASVLGLPVAAARLADHRGRSRWAAVLVAPFALGLLFRWGLLANLAALVPFLLTLPALDRFTDDPSWRRGAVVAAGGLAFALLHSSAPVVLGTVALALALARGPTPVRLARAALALGPAALLVAVQLARFRERADETFVQSRAISSALVSRLLGVPVHLYGPIGRPLALTLCGFFGAALAALALGVDAPRAEGPLRRHRFTLAAALLALQYLVWPYSIGGTGLVFLRFLAPALVLFAVAAPPGGTLVRYRVLVATLASASVALMLLGVAPAFRTAHKGYRTLARLVPLVARGSAIVELDLSETPGALAIFSHAHAHVAALRGGRTHEEFAALPQFPVRLRPEFAWRETTYRLQEPTEFVPEADLRRFRYALVRVPDARMIARLPAAMGPAARLVAVAGAWMLFESRLPVAPLASPEPRGVPRGVPTLGQRLLR